VIDQELKVWAKNSVIDGVTNVSQLKTLGTEEFDEGWLRGSSVSAQQLNTILRLLTIWSPPAPNCASLYPTGVTLPSTALECNGSTAIVEADAPNAYDLYGATTPDLSASAPAGFRYIIRKS
jgi:hypothetical protein